MPPGAEVRLRPSHYQLVEQHPELRGRDTVKMQQIERLQVRALPAARAEAMSGGTGSFVPSKPRGAPRGKGNVGQTSAKN